MKIAIIKPDHLGDLILSAAAIRALTNGRDATLFVAPNNLKLAHFLFPGVEIGPIQFSHLAKSAGSSGEIPDLRGFDLVVFLRNDGVITPRWATLRCRDFLMTGDTHADHQSVIDYGVAAAVAGPYDIDALHFGASYHSVLDKTRKPSSRIGLSIGSGFHANAWPSLRWVELGRRLQEHGATVRVVTGPAEIGMAQFIARSIGLDPRAGLIIGSDDYAGLLQEVGELDEVVASDGGTAHLCSLVTPVTSVFGPSPFRRYAPLGAWCRLVRLEVGCSPCCQYEMTRVNGCLSVECMSGLQPADVLHALGGLSHTGLADGLVEQWGGRQFFVGVSHIDRERKLSQRIEMVRHGY